MKKNLVLIGNGMAGVKTIEEVLKLTPDLYNITIFGEENFCNYNRIMLSPVLAKEKTVEDIMINNDQWYSDNNITLNKGKKVVEIKRDQQLVIASDGTTVAYDRLIIATGSLSFILPVPGSDKEGVIGFRDINDVELMLNASQHYKHAVVIGGGLLGLEAANGLRTQGMEVTVVHLLDTLMERQLDPTAAKMLQKDLESKGLKFLLQHATQEIVGETRAEALRFKDGTEIPADLVVMAVGIKPNISLAKESGLHCERGIVVNDAMQSITDPRIYIIGECAQHRGIAYGLVAPLFEQGKVAANHIAEYGNALYSGTVTSTKLKVTGVDLFSAGDFNGNDDTEEMILKDDRMGRYKKIILNNNKIIGTVLFGDTSDGNWYYQLLKDETDISGFRDSLLFGQDSIGEADNNVNTNTAIVV